MYTHACTDHFTVSTAVEHLALLALKIELSDVGLTSTISKLNKYLKATEAQNEVQSKQALGSDNLLRGTSLFSSDTRARSGVKL